MNNWNPYPDIEPQGDTRQLLVTLDGGCVDLDVWLGKCKVFSKYSVSKNNVIAWRELPKPYEKPEPLDMHPDAVYARQWAEGLKWSR